MPLERGVDRRLTVVDGSGRRGGRFVVAPSVDQDHVRVAGELQLSEDSARLAPLIGGEVQNDFQLPRGVAAFW